MKTLEVNCRKSKNQVIKFKVYVINKLRMDLYIKTHFQVPMRNFLNIRYD